MPVRPRELHYSVDLGDGKLREENGVALVEPPEWTPEHLLLAALVRCSLASLEYHAKRADLTIRTRVAWARGTVTKREHDERYAFVEIVVGIGVTLDPAVPDDLAALLAKAERDCFIGASLTVKPEYRWMIV